MFFPYVAVITMLSSVWSLIIIRDKTHKSLKLLRLSPFSIMTETENGMKESKQLTAQLNQHSIKFNTRQKDTESPR